MCNEKNISEQEICSECVFQKRMENTVAVGDAEEIYDALLEKGYSPEEIKTILDIASIELSAMEFFSNE